MSDDINVGAISEALNNKTDLDFNNMQPSNLSKETIVGWGMPATNRYVTLTLGASGSTYVAPANGWFCIRATATSNNAFFNLLNHSSSILMIADLTNNISTQADDCELHIPAKKGDEIGAWYVGFGMTQSNNYFRFIYAEGEQ